MRLDASQYVMSVAKHMDERNGYYAVMVRMDGLAGVDGPFDTWNEAAESCRHMAEAVAQLGHGGTMTELSRDHNGQETQRVRQFTGQTRGQARNN